MLANETVKEVQHLDNTGYSGHLSFIFYLLNKPKFKKAYLSGRFNPGKNKNFCMSHDILINRFTRCGEGKSQSSGYLTTFRNPSRVMKA